MYLLPKIHKSLVNIPGRPVMSNCGTPTEKASEFLDHHLQLMMKSGMSYIKDTNDVFSKLKNLKKVRDNAILVTSDVVGLYPSIPHNGGLKKKQLDNFYEKPIPTEDLAKMSEFVLKNNYFEFNSNVKHQLLLVRNSPHRIYMDYMENQFLKNEQVQSMNIWFRYIDDIFFIWTASEKELDDFLERLNNFHPNLKFTRQRSREEINFLDVTVRVNHVEFITNLYCKPTDGHQYLHVESCHPSHTKSSIILVRL